MNTIQRVILSNEILDIKFKVRGAAEELGAVLQKLNQLGSVDHGLASVLGKLQLLADNPNEDQLGEGLNSVIKSVMDNK